MLLKFKGNEPSEYLAQQITLLTGKSYFQVKKLDVNEAQGRVRFCLTRSKCNELKSRAWRMFKSPSYDQSREAYTVVNIGEVKTVELINNFDPDREEFQVEEGILIRDKEIVITSVDENRGDPFFSLVLKFDKLDLSLEDRAEKVPVLEK